jgi:hypothetical protein
MTTVALASAIMVCAPRVVVRKVTTVELTVHKVSQLCVLLVMCVRHGETIIKERQLDIAITIHQRPFSQLQQRLLLYHPMYVLIMVTIPATVFKGMLVKIVNMKLISATNLSPISKVLL